MLNVPLDRIITVTEARDNFAKVVDGAKGGEIYVLTKGGRPCVAVVDVRFLEETTGQKLNTQVIPAGAWNQALKDKPTEPADDIEETKPVLEDLESPEKESLPASPSVSSITEPLEENLDEKPADKKDPLDFKEFSDTVNKPAADSSFSLPSADTIQYGKPDLAESPKPTTTVPGPFSMPSTTKTDSNPLPDSTTDVPTPSSSPINPITAEPKSDQPKTTTIPIQTGPSMATNPTVPTAPVNQTTQMPQVANPASQATPTPPVQPTANTPDDLDDLDIG